MNEYLAQISLVCQLYPEQTSDILNSLSSTQYKSKQWLVTELCNWVTDEAPTILIIGGWYGSYLIPMLKEKYSNCKIIHTDKDPLTIEIASKLHKKQTDCVFEVLDAETPTKRYTPDILINTSCEHMMTIGQHAITNQTTCLYALQSCDSTKDPGHVNASIDTKDFSKKCNLLTELLCARINLGNKNRFMSIGFK